MTRLPPETLDRLADAGAPLLVATMDGIASGDLEPQAQPGEGVSHAAKLTVDDARIDFTHPALAVDEGGPVQQPHRDFPAGGHARRLARVLRRVGALDRPPVATKEREGTMGTRAG